MQYRSSLLGRMAQLWHEAHTRLGENLNHQSIVETPQHREAMALSQRVRGSLGPLDTILRSERIKPDFGSDMYDSDYPWGTAVARVVASRAALLRQNSSKYSVAEVAHGLLLYDPAENLADGSAEYSSSGFFDTNNILPGTSG
jgi:hypothetical protein